MLSRGALHHPPAHARTLSMSQPSLADKVSVLVNGLRMNRDVDFVHILHQACELEVVRLLVPETLYSTDSSRLLLYTDASGIVREEFSSPPASSTSEAFSQMCSVKRKALRNMNPQGLRFPKFVRFGEDGFEGVVMSKRELDFDTLGVIQRYVIPEKYIVQTRYVLWRRTRRTKMYLLCNRASFKSSISPHFSPTSSPSALPHHDQCFLASIRHIRSCLVSKDTRLFSEVETILATVLGLLEKYAIVPGEILEEVVFPLSLCQDGGLYMLLNVRAKVISDFQAIPLVPKRRQKIEEFLATDPILAKINSMALPTISLSDIAESTRTMYHQQVCPQKTVKPVTSDPHITEYLNEVVSKLDRLRTESSILKKEFGVLRKMDFSKYSDQFLDRVITRAYDVILRDARLARYYERVPSRNKLEAAVKKAMLSGTSRYLRMSLRKIHCRMGVSDADYDLYVRYFIDALCQEEAREEDLSEMRLFFEDMRREIVIPLHDVRTDQSEPA